jgi:hypothetical protein
MSSTNAERIRTAMARVETLLGELGETPIEVWLDPPNEPPPSDPGQLIPAARRLKAASDVERILSEARVVAKALHEEESRRATAMLVQAERVAEQLQDRERAAASALLADAQLAAAELHAEQIDVAEALMVEARRVAASAG